MTFCVEGTPLEDHRKEFGLVVKREDLCMPGGPNFSKCRGVFAHATARPEGVIGVLDTSHSQGGWAVARACAMLGKQCVEFYPVRKATPGWRGEVQDECERLGAQLVPLQAGRSAVLYHQARSLMAAAHGTDGYLFPNALKLPEMITETAAEVARTPLPPVSVVLVSASSGTIAAGVLVGLRRVGYTGGVVVHQGYSRPQGAMRAYMERIAGEALLRFDIVDEDYAYADAARPGPVPPWQCNSYYDLKAFRWHQREGRTRYGDDCLFWNIG